jgi:hypothetical protein
MKKLVTIFSAVLFLSATLVSCGGNELENDAKKLAKMTCEMQKLMKSAPTDLSAVANATKLTAEATAFSVEMKKKYTEQEDFKLFGEIMEKELANCK